MSSLGARLPSGNGTGCGTETRGNWEEGQSSLVGLREDQELSEREEQLEVQLMCETSCKTFHLHGGAQ